MSRRALRFPFKVFAAVLSVTCFLAFGQGAVSSALAANNDTFETWPKKPAEPGVEPAAKAGEAAGEKTAEGISAGTWGWIAAGAAGLIIIFIAAGNGGATTTSNH